MGDKKVRSARVCWNWKVDECDWRWWLIEVRNCEGLGIDGRRNDDLDVMRSKE